MPPIWKGGGRFLGNEELKKGTRIAEFLRDADRPRRHRASKRRTALSFLPHGLPSPSPRCYRSASQGRAKNDDGALRPIIFPSLRNISTPLQRANSFRSRCRATLRNPEQNGEQNRAAPPVSVRAALPFPLNVRDPSIPGPPLNADRESALFQSRANGNNSPRAKKIIKC